ncbi:hypothetical protein JZ751_001238 [Albula glossodonta]|uniref:G-protein signaling modulator 1 n=1 Tax=Albula glossodonta TaxID=121402 RepID=A0A8T2PTC1_9TELE|nr:hypothetical protein JZ751_001238 [Albula glossodonta]
MALSTNGVDQELASKRLHSRQCSVQSFLHAPSSKPPHPTLPQGPQSVNNPIEFCKSTDPHIYCSLHASAVTFLQLTEGAPYPLAVFPSFQRRISDSSLKVSTPTSSLQVIQTSTLAPVTLRSSFCMMSSVTPNTESRPLSGAQQAVCRLAHCGPRPRPLLRPLHLELGAYVQKTRVKQKKRMEASCLELALEGERLCKVRDFKGGAAFFEAAVQVGTEDLKTLSAIYSQLGNAYFYLKEYAKALEYHRHDLTLARTIGDRIGEGKASGNLGNTLKVLGRFDEAVVCCQRHLDISREQGDKVGEARALYNIGNVFHGKGKQQAWGSSQDPGDLPHDVRDILQKATEYYEMNLSLVKELGDRAAQGRAFGNLGNTHYLLGNFVEAIKFHRERLSIAKEFGDKAAERRAYSNLGNALIFLGQKTLQLSRQLKDRVMEAQACYSLGNTYTLLQTYDRAIDYHLKHLLIAQELTDRVGEGRACWSLGNAYVSLGNHRQALHYARKHLDISQEIGDRNGELTARMNVEQLMEALGVSEGELSPCVEFQAQGARPKFSSRDIMDSVDLWKYTSEKEQNGDCNHLDDASRGGRGHSSGPGRRTRHPESRLGDERPWRAGRGSPLDTDDIRVQVTAPPQHTPCPGPPPPLLSPGSEGDPDGRTPESRNETFSQRGNPDGDWCKVGWVSQVYPFQKLARDPSDEDCFFDLLSKFQSSRMDDQRCRLDEPQDTPEGRAEGGATSSPESPLGDLMDSCSLISSPQTEELFDLIASSQSRRLDDQRANVGNLPGLRITQNNLGHLCGDADPQEPSDDFFNMLIKCQSSRIDDQRCSPPDSGPRAPTVPDEDFFSLIQRVQAKRMDEQRVHLPSDQQDDPDSDPPSPPSGDSS